MTILNTTWIIAIIVLIAPVYARLQFSWPFNEASEIESFCAAKNKLPVMWAKTRLIHRWVFGTDAADAAFSGDPEPKVFEKRLGEFWAVQTLGLPEIAEAEVQSKGDNFVGRMLRYHRQITRVADSLVETANQVLSESFSNSQTIELDMSNAEEVEQIMQTPLELEYEKVVEKFDYIREFAQLQGGACEIMLAIATQRSHRKTFMNQQDIISSINENFPVRSAESRRKIDHWSGFLSRVINFARFNFGQQVSNPLLFESKRLPRYDSQDHLKFGSFATTTEGKVDERHLAPVFAYYIFSWREFFQDVKSGVKAWLRGYNVALIATLRYMIQLTNTDSAKIRMHLARFLRKHPIYLKHCPGPRPIEKDLTEIFSVL